MLQFGTDCKIVKIVLKVHHVSYNVYLLHYCKLYSNLFYSDDDTNIVIYYLLSVHALHYKLMQFNITIKD